jgi:hypothetical protein
MRPVIEAIPAVYAATRFRSTLEARWASFFDALGVRWEYEPASFIIPARKHAYTPDFRLPELEIIIEVKPCPVTDRDLVEKYEAYGPELVRRGECRLFLFAVGPPKPDMQLHGWWRHGERGFSFEPLYGIDGVVAGCIVADHLHPKRALEDRRSDGVFADLSLFELKSLSLVEVKAMLVGLSLAEIRAGTDPRPYADQYGKHCGAS